MRLLKIQLPFPTTGALYRAHLDKYSRQFIDAISGHTSNIDPSDPISFFILAISREIRCLYASVLFTEVFGPERDVSDVFLTVPCPLKGETMDTGLCMLYSDVAKEIVSARITVLQESIDAVLTGTPLRAFRRPTTLFLYVHDVKPVYCGHIFVQEESSFFQKHLFFVSIYKSFSETSTYKFSDRVIDDIESFAKQRRCRQIYTAPLPNMMRTLKAKGFVRPSWFGSKYEGELRKTLT